MMDREIFGAIANLEFLYFLVLCSSVGVEMKIQTDNSSLWQQKFFFRGNINKLSVVWQSSKQLSWNCSFAQKANQSERTKLVAG